MLKRLNRLVLGAVLATCSAQAMAQSAGWLVSEVRGPVTILSSHGQSAATRGTTLHPGDTVATGAGARAVIVRDKDFVTVAPNSRIRIPAETRRSAVTQFFQDIGNAIFNVGKRGTPHFSVDTPYLAAVVKGTVFSVTVDADRTVLQVTEGVVEVSTTDGGARDLIRPGSIAMIAANDRYRLTISGDAARVVDSPARPAMPEPAPTAPPDSTADASALPPPAAKAADGDMAGVRIVDAVASKPVDLALATNGVLTGLSPVSATAAGLAQAGPSAAHEVAPKRGGTYEHSSADKAEGGPDGGTPGDKLVAGKPEYQPDIGKPVEQTDAGKPEDTPDAGKPEDTAAGKPEDTPDAGKPEDTPDAGKPEDTPDPGKPEGTPDAGKPEGTPDAGKPEDTPDAGKPEDAPDPGKPDGTPDAGKPEGTPDVGKPEDTPDAGKPEDTPDAGKPEDTPDAGKPEDTPDAGKPEDTPDAGKPQDTPDAGKPDDTPDAGKPEDTPDAGKPEDTPDAGKPDDKPDIVKPDPGKPK